MPEPVDAPELNSLDYALRQTVLREAQTLTPVIRGLAGAREGAVVELESRFVPQGSTASETQELDAADPGISPGMILPQDVLQYTILFEDQPPGNYSNAVTLSLLSLQQAGYEIREVKNYWTGNDPYSGVNVRLRSPSRLFWQLQFHTRASWETRNRTRPDYERLQEAGISQQERQSLFETCMRQWNAVPVPEGVLQPGALHPDAELSVIPLGR